MSATPLLDMIAKKNGKNTTNNTNTNNVQNTYYCTCCGVRHNVKTGCDNPYNR